jgi:hypothetical protein
MLLGIDAIVLVMNKELSLYFDTGISIPVNDPRSKYNFSRYGNPSVPNCFQNVSIWKNSLESLISFLYF